MPLNFASLMEDDLGDALTNRQRHTLVLVEVVDFHSPTVDIARIAPASVEAGGNAVAAPAGAGLHLGGAGGINADKLASVGQNALTRAQYDNLLLSRDAGKELAAICFTPFIVADGLEGAFEIALYVGGVERIVIIAAAITFGNVKPFA